MCTTKPSDHPAFSADHYPAIKGDRTSVPKVAWSGKTAASITGTMSIRPRVQWRDKDPSVAVIAEACSAPKVERSLMPMLPWNELRAVRASHTKCFFNTSLISVNLPPETA